MDQGRESYLYYIRKDTIVNNYSALPVSGAEVGCRTTADCPAVGLPVAGIAVGGISVLGIVDGIEESGAVEGWMSGVGVHEGDIDAAGLITISPVGIGETKHVVPSSAHALVLNIANRRNPKQITNIIIPIFILVCRYILSKKIINNK